MDLLLIITIEDSEPETWTSGRWLRLMVSANNLVQELPNAVSQKASQKLSRGLDSKAGSMNRMESSENRPWPVLDQ